MIPPSVWVGKGVRLMSALLQNQRASDERMASRAAFDVTPRLLEELRKRYPMRHKAVGEDLETYNQYVGKLMLIDEMQTMYDQTADFNEEGAVVVEPE